MERKMENIKCEICNQEASGIHYGATTCEACKVFFRRTNGRDIPSGSNCSGNCQPTGGKRPFNCPRCRLNRCLQAGMTIALGKRGRYSHEKKVQILGRIRSQSSESSTSPEATDNKEPVFSKKQNEMRRNSNSPTSTTDTKGQNLNKTGTMETIDTDTTGTKDPDSTKSVLSREEINVVVEELLRTNRQLYGDWIPDDTFNMEKHYAEYLDGKALLQDIFGDMQPILPEDFKRLYSETGIDIDGRVSEMLAMMPLAKRQIECLIGFVRMLPGYSQLSSADKVALVKGGRAEDGVLSLHRLGDPLKELFLEPMSQTVMSTDADIKWTGDEFFAKHIYVLGRRLRTFHLTDQEEVLLKAMAIYSPDRCITQEGSRVVEEIQQLFAEHLEGLLKESHPNDKNLFGKTLVFLSDLRTYTAYYDFHTDNILKTFQYSLPLPREIYPMLSSDGLAYEASKPRCDDAPPVIRVKEMLTGQSVDTTMNKVTDCALDTVLDGLVVC